MTPQVTEELRHALEATQNCGPVTLVDPVSNRKYILLREDVYNRFRAFSKRRTLISARRMPPRIPLRKRHGVIPATRTTIITMLTADHECSPR